MEAEKKSSSLLLKLHRAHADAIKAEAIAACSPASPSVELSPWSHESIAPTPIHAQILAACARSEEVGHCPSHTMPAAGLRSHLSSKQDLHAQVRQTSAADRDAQNGMCARVCVCACVSQAEAGFRQLMSRNQEQLSLLHGRLAQAKPAGNAPEPEPSRGRLSCVHSLRAFWPR